MSNTHIFILETQNFDIKIRSFFVKGDPVDFLSLERDGDYPVIYDFQKFIDWKRHDCHKI